MSFPIPYSPSWEVIEPDPRFTNFTRGWDMDDIYKIVTSQEFNDFFSDYRNEVDDIVDGRTRNLTMEEAATYYGISNCAKSQGFKRLDGTKI